MLEAASKSRIYAGLRPATTAANLRQALTNGKLAQRLAHFTPKPGDAVFIPAGTVHTLGNDAVVFEIQQNSDATFRLYDWAVSKLGQLGVVSGTALDSILARRLQDGDTGGHMRRGLDDFPIPEIAERIWQTYYIAGGKTERAPYKALPAHAKDAPRELQELCVVANFVEVFLAREGHDHPVGINYLEQRATRCASHSHRGAADY